MNAGHAGTDFFFCDFLKKKKYILYIYIYIFCATVGHKKILNVFKCVGVRKKGNVLVAVLIA